MALRGTPTARRDKEKLRQNKKSRLLLSTNESRMTYLKPAREIDEVNPKQLRHL